MLRETLLSQKMSQTHYQNFEFRNKYFKDQGYKKGEFFANLMMHLNKSPMNASKLIKAPTVRINMSVLRPFYCQKLQEKRSKQISTTLTHKRYKKKEKRVLSIIDKSQNSKQSLTFFKSKRNSAL